MLKVLNALFDISFGVIAKILFGVGWIISVIFGIAIAIEAWILGFILQINTEIINSPPVAVGFPVALSLANLALVFAIVVIAIMTILRIQTYGVKQTLWKLIVIAVAINFGLVAAGVILQFFDSLSFYFLNSVNPAGGEGNQSGFSSFVNFSSALAGAFNPQRSFLGLQDNPANIKPEQLAAGFGATIGSLITPITNLVFTIFALIFIIISLGALIIMLIIRYVYLGYLLILLPLAWASWIFPATRDHWNKWWHNFFNQAAFAPIVLFFLWIAIQTSYAMSSSEGPYKFGDYYNSNSNPVWAAISEFFTNLFDPVIKQLLQIAVLLGVMLGGLFAAKSMSIKFADAATGEATRAAKAFGDWVSRKGIQAGTAAFRGKQGQELAASLQRGRAQQRLRSIPVVGKALGLGASYVGGGIEKIGAVGADQALQQAEKNIENMSDRQIANALSRFDAPHRWAAIQRLKKNNNLDFIVGDLGKYFGLDKKTEAARYGLEEFFETTRGEVGLTVLDKIRNLKNQGKNNDEIMRAVAGEIKGAKNAQYLAKNFILDEEKFKALNPLGIQDLSEFKEYQSYIMGGLAMGASGSALSSFYTEIARGKQLDIARDAMSRSGITKTMVEKENPSADIWFQNTAARNLGVDYRNNGVVIK